MLSLCGSRYRDQFPVTERLVYLNHAAVAPLCRRAAEAMQHLAQDALEFGSEHYPKWMETYEGLRASTARLINATPAEIAIVKNTSEGIATVATGIDVEARRRRRRLRRRVPRQLLSVETPRSGAESKSAGSRSSTISNASTRPAKARGCWPSATSSI